MIPKIYKYVLTPEGTTIGEGYSVKPLSVGWQGDDLVLWAEVEDKTELLESVGIPLPAGIYVLAVPTGAERPPAAFEYIGTAHDGPKFMAGRLVMHVYYTTLRNH